MSTLDLQDAVLASWCYLRRHANYLHPQLTERLLHHCIGLLSGECEGSDSKAFESHERQSEEAGTVQSLEQPQHSPALRSQQQSHDVVLLLTLAASFAASPGRFAAAEHLFSTIAARAGHMQQEESLNDSKRKALENLQSKMEASSVSAARAAAGSAEGQAAETGVLGSSSLHALSSSGRVVEAAYPTLPLSLRLTPTYEAYEDNGGVAWIERAERSGR